MQPSLVSAQARHMTGRAQRLDPAVIEDRLWGRNLTREQEMLRGRKTKQNTTKPHLRASPSHDWACARAYQASVWLSLRASYGGGT